MQTFVSLFLSCSILFLSFGVHSAPPQTLDYQGYLANSGGVPLTGSVNVSISLYTAVSGGSALWTQASSPALSNGRFAVVLDGSGGNAFPAAVFDQPLFVGLTVDTDPEMTPRQPLTSVPSAFEAMNADTVDGMQANEIIDAASDEVRTPIDSLPRTITDSGSYYLTQNLTATVANGLDGLIDVNADNVTIDLMGFTLDGNGVNDYGIKLYGYSALVIKNGHIRNFGRSAIYSNPVISGIVVMDIHAVANGSLGSSNIYSGMYLYGNGQRVERCFVEDNGGYGIYVGNSSLVKDSTVINSGGSYGIYAGFGSALINNMASNNQGTGIYGPSGSTLTNNTAHFNQGAYGVYGGSGSTLENNTAYDNQGIGVYGTNGSTLTGNTAYSNSGTGISGGTSSTLTNNTAYNNSGSGITSGAGSTLTNNTAYLNQNWGIFAGAANTVIGNTVVANNQAQTVDVGGLLIGNDSQVVNNTADNNYDVGIFVGGSDNVIRNNHATDSSTLSGHCIYFSNSDNAAIGNTATGCIYEFAGAYPTTIDRDNDAW